MLNIFEKFWPKEWDVAPYSVNTLLWGAKEEKEEGKKTRVAVLEEAEVT
jgi:hypothetical protein